jgi:hypothetical protein
MGEAERKRMTPKEMARIMTRASTGKNQRRKVDRFELSVKRPPEKLRSFLCKRERGRSEKQKYHRLLLMEPIY